jgi:uncharacterized protein YndB with AHSA1/START domain
VSSRHGTVRVTLPSDREIVITRRFDAPAPLVFTAWTTPAYVRRWWGSDEAPMVVCDIDLRVGGRWRYVTRSTDGTELGWRGVYREIVVGSRLVATELFEAHPEGEAVTTLTFTERDGVTTLTATVVHRSRENRDGHVASGMERGMQHTMDRLEDLVTGEAPRTTDPTNEERVP